MVSSLLLANTKPDLQPVITSVTFKYLKSANAIDPTPESMFESIRSPAAFYQEMTSTVAKELKQDLPKIEGDMSGLVLDGSSARADVLFVYGDEKEPQKLEFVLENGKWFIGSKTGRDWRPMMTTLQELSKQVQQELRTREGGLPELP
jgi:hypothetical protein